MACSCWVHPNINKDPVKVIVLGDGKQIWYQKFDDNHWREIFLGPDNIKNLKRLVFKVSRTWNPKISGISEDNRDLGIAIAIVKMNS